MAKGEEGAIPKQFVGEMLERERILPCIDRRRVWVSQIDEIVRVCHGNSRFPQNTNPYNNSVCRGINFLI
ncbi:hypothetical protein CEXT_40381 [Caerostris extrusa]|uniref:Uncharacterized protein n=1 Tax=Caerostris extrusa TaxID=172846 RepID=A0AAV4YA07_CAEEX|nr:hypothetical protein CEXT_40381 [Caerostris extrusa]